jgi:hypothetical protein
MKGGQDSKPMSPYGVPGPASAPVADSLRNLASDPDLIMRSFVAGSLATQAGFEQASKKSDKETDYSWAIFLYLTIVVVAVIIYFLPSATPDQKNQALGFVFGQAPLLVSALFKNKDKNKD